MLKNIYIQLGSPASLAPIVEFGKKEQGHLAKQGLYFPLLKDFIPNHSKHLESFDDDWHIWLQDSMSRLYSQENARIAQKNAVDVVEFPSQKNCLDLLANYLKEQKFHSLCLCLSAFNHDTDKTLATVQALKKHFPSANLHFSFFLLPPDRELEGIWLYRAFFLDAHLPTMAENTKYRVQALFLAEKNLVKVERFLDQKIATHYIMSSDESLENWQKTFNIAPLAEQKHYNRPFPCPSVLAFIDAFPKKNYPQGHSFPWLQEKEFLIYNAAQNKKIGYLTTEQRQEVRANFATLSKFSFPFQKELSYQEENLEDRHLSPKEALSLAKKLSPALRQELAKCIDKELLPYQSLNTAAAQGAVLCIEKQLSEEDFFRLAKGQKLSHIKEVCFDFVDLDASYLFSKLYTKNKENFQKQGLFFAKIEKIDSNFLAKLTKKLTERKNITKLCLNLQYYTNNNEIATILEHFQGKCPLAKVQCHFYLSSPEKMLKNPWFRDLSTKKFIFSLAHYVRYSQDERNIFHAIQSKVSFLQTIFKGLANFSSPHSPEAMLSDWADRLGIDLQSLELNFPKFFIPSPKVLAFIATVQSSAYSANKNFDYAAQEAFYGYEQEVQACYLRPFWQKKIRENVRRSIDEHWLEQLDGFENLENSPLDVSDAPLTLGFEEAFKLCKLLDTGFRQSLLEDLEISTLPHQNQGAINVYTALLLAEKRLDEKEAQALVQSPRGLCLPLGPNSRIEVGELHKPKVAVLTMAYNHEKYIERCIKSVLSQQTNFPVMHVISDDFSSDGTREILLEYAKKYPHIKLILNAYNSPGSVVQKLFDQIPAEYVALCDGDDYFSDPLKLQKQADLLDKDKSLALCFHLVMTLFEDKPGIGKIFPPMEYMPRGLRAKYYLKELLELNFIQTNSVMYRWRFKDQGLPLWYAHGTCPSDRYWHLIHAELGPIGFINEVMSVYWRHKGGHFFEAVDNPLGHRNNHGLQEIIIYDILDLHFEGRYTQICHSLSKNVLLDVAKQMQKTKNSEYLEKVLSICPALNQYVVKKKSGQMA